MIDLKYHIASLAAVFLALAAGILIGSSMVGTASVESQIRRLRTGFDRIQAQDRKLHAENQALRHYQRTLESAIRLLVPAAVRARLSGKRIAVFACGKTADAALLSDIKAILATAGASVSSITTFGENLLPENPASRRALFAQTGVDGVDPERARNHIARLLVHEIILARNPDLVRLVRQCSPGLALDGDYTLPADAALLLPAVDKAEQERAIADGVSIIARVADALRSLQIPAVACEVSTCQTPLIPHLARYNLATVDRVDTALGRTALVYALAGKRGHYGTRPPAAQLLPELDVEPLTIATAPPARSPQRAHRAPEPRRE